KGCTMKRQRPSDEARVRAGCSLPQCCRPRGTAGDDATAGEGTRGLDRAVSSAEPSRADRRATVGAYREAAAGVGGEGPALVCRVPGERRGALDGEQRRMSRTPSSITASPSAATVIAPCAAGGHGQEWRGSRLVLAVAEGTARQPAGECARDRV